MHTNLLDFMITTSEALGRIEATQEDCKRDLETMKTLCVTIPLIERGLNNHLTTHDKISKRLFYPVVVILTVSTIVFLLKAIFHINLF